MTTFMTSEKKRKLSYVSFLFCTRATHEQATNAVCAADSHVSYVHGDQFKISGQPVWRNSFLLAMHTQNQSADTACYFGCPSIVFRVAYFMNSAVMKK